MTLVSIIIVNYNGKRFLDECLSSIYSISYSNYEVILVDNSSSDGSVDFVAEKFPDVIIKQLEKNFGFAKANNVGADIANGDLLLFLNNDTKVTKGFLEPLVAEIQSNDTAICQSLLLKPDGTVDSAGDFVDKYGRAFSSRVVPEKSSPILSARGACMMIKKDVFDELEGFDEKFFVSFEDVDIGWCAWIYGYKVMVVPKSIVYHHGGGTISAMSDVIKFHGAKNTLFLRLTNFEWDFVFISMLFLILDVLKRKFSRFSQTNVTHNVFSLPSSKILIKAIIWNFRNYKYLFSKRKIISHSRTKSTKNLIKLGLIKNKSS